MLVQCPECTTKYNLDENKILHEGSKVRCTRCKNVFTVFRPMPPQSDEPVPVEPAPRQSPVVDQGLDDELDALFSNPPTGPKFATSPPASQAARQSSSPSVDEDMLADLQGAFQPPLVGKTAKDPLLDDDFTPPRVRKSSRKGLVVGLLLLVVLMAGAGVYFLQPGLLGLRPVSPFAPQEPETTVREGAAQIALENVRQYFVPNEKEGQLFIIEGKAANRFPEARELIRLKASLYDKQGNEVTSQEFMCGNVVSLYQLQVSSRQDIEQALTAKVGILTNNTNVQPGASVPFMVVFFNAPDSVEEFGLEVLQSSLPQ